MKPAFREHRRSSYWFAYYLQRSFMLLRAAVIVNQLTHSERIAIHALLALGED